MRTILYFIFIYVFALQANAQFAEKHNIYTKFGLEPGTHLGVNVSYNYVYNNTYSLELGVRWYFQTSKLRPDDFNGGIESALSLGFSDGKDFYKDIYVLGGKVIPFKNTKEKRLHLKIGFAYSTVDIATNFQPAPPALFTPNYTFNRRKYATLGYIINPVVEFMSSQYAGFYISPHIIINKQTIFIGLGLGCQLGLLRGKNATKSINRLN